MSTVGLVLITIIACVVGRKGKIMKGKRKMEIPMPLVGSREEKECENWISPWGSHL